MSDRYLDELHDGGDVGLDRGRGVVVGDHEHGQVVQQRQQDHVQGGQLLTPSEEGVARAMSQEVTQRDG